MAKAIPCYEPKARLRRFVSGHTLKARRSLKAAFGRRGNPLQYLGTFRSTLSDHALIPPARL
jgi:hypothetical protein